MKTLKIVTIVAIAAVLAAAAGVATASLTASVLAKSSSTTLGNFGQCQKHEVERGLTHDLAHDECKAGGPPPPPPCPNPPLCKP